MRRVNREAESVRESLRALEHSPSADNLTKALAAIDRLRRVVVQLDQRQKGQRGPGRPPKQLSKTLRADLEAAILTYLREHNTPDEIAKRVRKRSKPIQLPRFPRAIMKGRRRDLIPSAVKMLERDLSRQGTDWITILERVALKWFDETGQ